MKISTIQVQNYRKFEDVILNFAGEDIMILSGANNSGKTSIITLLYSIFNNKNNLSFSDIALNTQKSYITKLIKKLNEYTFTDKKDFLTKYVSIIDNTISESLIKVKFKITYNEDEPIGMFANYLMDLDISKRNFFFEYTYALDINNYARDINEYGKELYETFNEVNLIKPVDLQINSFMDLVFESLENSLMNKYFYCDEDYELKNEIDFKKFSQLFNFKHISANRLLNDEDPNFKSMTEQILSIDNPLKEGTWKDDFKKLQKNTKTTLEDSDVKDKFNTSTQDELKNIKEKIDIVKTNEFEEIITDMNLEDEKMLNFITSIFSIKYSYNTDAGKLILSENSQGLGVSNLIYITLEINKFITDLNSNCVNILVIEEPENHMHIQMQKIFIDFIVDGIKPESNFQYIITSHSTELIKEVPLKTVKVIRSVKSFSNFIVDFSTVIEEKSVDVQRYYETLFKLNFIQIIFADYAIFFEGDTERMYFEDIINRSSKFSDLSKQYIAYCQVGGAYAHNYFDLINKLKIRTVVFTDLDYRNQKDGVLLDDLDSALSSDTTNYTLQNIIKENNDVEDNNLNCKLLLEKINSQNNNHYYKVFTQGELDGYGRTLEDTLLYSYISKEFKELEIENVFTKISRESWKEIINLESEEEKHQEEFQDEQQETNAKRLHLSVPNKSEASIRYVSDKIDKSNFMYSIISNNLSNKIIPNYINEGLSWLKR